MKLFLYCLVLLGIVPPPLRAAQLVPAGGTNTVVGLLAYTEDLLLTLRSNVTAQLHQCATNPALTTDDLVQLRNALGRLRDYLSHADVGTQLSNAETRAQAALASAASGATDPADRTNFLPGLSEREFRSRIETQRANAAFLRTDLDGAISALNASLRVATPLQDVLPQAELGKRLATRLSGLLAEWERSAPKSRRSPGGLITSDSSPLAPTVDTDKETNNAVAQFHANSNAPTPVVRLPQNVATLISMVQARVEEMFILRFITSLDTPFDLITADQIIQARQEGLNDKLISAMLRHDGLLHARATGRAMRSQPVASGNAQPF